MGKRNCTNTMFFWSIETGDMALIPKGCCVPAKYDRYRSGLGCYTHYQKMTFEQRKAAMLVEFVHCVVRDGIDPQELHNLFLELEEYRDSCSLDMPNAVNAKRKHGEATEFSIW